MSPSRVAHTGELVTILVNYRTADMTLSAVEALVEASDLSRSSVIIVDNGSEDGSASHLRSAVKERGWSHAIEVVEAEDNRGFGAGCNVGIRRVMQARPNPEFIYLLNTDAFCEADTVSALVEFLKQNPNAGIAGSVCHDRNREPRSTAFRFPSLASELDASVRLGMLSRWLENSSSTLPLPTKPVRCDWITGASMMFKSEVLRRVGLFDEGFFLYFEETDLCFRAGQAGYEVWCVPESRVLHLRGATTGTTLSRSVPEHWFRSRRRFLNKSRGAAYLALADAVRVVGHTAYRAHRRLSGRPSEDPPGFLRDLLHPQHRA